MTGKGAGYGGSESTKARPNNENRQRGVGAGHFDTPLEEQGYSLVCQKT